MQMQASATARRSPLSAYAAGTQAVTLLRSIIGDMAAQAAVWPIFECCFVAFCRKKALTHSSMSKSLFAYSAESVFFVLARSVTSNLKR